jgi:hypothetical protein
MACLHRSEFLAQGPDLVEALGDVAQDGGDAEDMALSIAKRENRELD